MVEMEAPAVARTRTRLPKKERHDAILTEAMKSLSETGYHGFSMNDLAKRCGLTNTGLLHHFHSKEGLLIALLQHRDKLDEIAVTQVLGPDAERGPCTLDVCLRSFRAMVARNAGQPEILRLYAILRAEALVPEHPAFTYFRSREMGIISLFQDMVSDIVPAPLATARQIVALMHGLETQWLREARIFDLVEEWDQAAALILGAETPQT